MSNSLDYYPTICISFAISHIIIIIIKFIFLSERNFMELKMQPTYMAACNTINKVKKNLIIKHFFFFILGLIFLFVFWVFISSFGAVYQNTQIILLENTLIIFGIALVYPFIYNIIPCLFRLCSLNNKKLFRFI